MIITCKKQIPMSWVTMATLPWAAEQFKSHVMGVCLLFSLKKFVENPAGITFILTLPGWISIFLAPASSYLSDCVWTRFGRRKPFIVPPWFGMALAMALMPLAPNMWWLIGIFMFYGICNDIDVPMQSLQMEIIPPPQRGRGTAVQMWCNNLAQMTFWYVAIGRFDDVQFMAGFAVTGETAIYWAGGLLCLVMVGMIMLGIKEANPKSSLVGKAISLKTFFTAILNRNLWPVYTLVFASTMLSAGLGTMGTLLMIDQWGYTKQEQGINMAVGGTLNLILIIPVLGIFADRMNRMKTYQRMIVIALGIKFFYYLYVMFILHDRRPSLVEIIFFGEALSIVGQLTAFAYRPLVYDYVTRNEMGTYGAGSGLMTRLTHIVTLNGVGLFVWAWAAFFMPPAGEMTRVVLNKEVSSAEVRAVLDKGSWISPQDDAAVAAANIDARAWYATGSVLDNGRCWEVRMLDEDSKKLVAEKDELVLQQSPLSGNAKMLRDDADALTRKNRIEDAKAKLDGSAKIQAEADELGKKIAAIDAVLKERANKFQAQVKTALGDLVIKDGEQIRSAGMGKALLLEFKALHRPQSDRLEKALNDLREHHPEVIDLRPVKHDDGSYSIVASTLLPENPDEQQIATKLRTDVQKAVGGRLPSLLLADAQVIKTELKPAMMMNLITVEEALDTKVSPITRVVNQVMRLWTDPPTSDRRINAVARGLRAIGETEHVRVRPVQDDHKAIVVIAIPKEGFSKPAGEDGISKRFASLLGEQKELAGQFKSIYDRALTTGSTQRMTIARPFLSAGYAPIKYDYLCGYIWMFSLGIIGLLITFAFARRESKGLIRKRGVEEAQAS